MTVDKLEPEHPPTETERSGPCSGCHTAVPPCAPQRRAAVAVKNTDIDTQPLWSFRRIPLPPLPVFLSVKWDNTLIHVDPLGGLKKLFVKKDEQPQEHS